MKRRGLTLLEMLLAVALLAAIAVACAPVISASLRALQAPAEGMTVEDLAAYAEQWVAEYESQRAQTRLSSQSQDGPASPRDAPSVAKEVSVEELTMLIEQAAGMPVKVERYETRSEWDHAWIMFRSGDVETLRMIAVEREEVERESGPEANSRKARSGASEH